MEFRELVRQYIHAHPSNARLLADELRVSILTVRRWSRGVGLPHSAIKQIVQDFIEVKNLKSE